MGKLKYLISGTKQVCMNRVGPNIAYIKCAVFVRRLANVNLTHLDQNDLSKILLKYLHHVTSGFYPVEQ